MSFLLTGSSPMGTIVVMPRRLRFATDGFVFHVLNGAVGPGSK
jgi:hypothetical protein